MTSTEFASVYSPSAGPIRLGATERAPHGVGRYEFTATLAFGDTIYSASVISHGPAEAFTSMLYDAGVNLEILSFHQRATDAGIVTFVRGQHNSRIAWAMGTGSDATESTAKALVAAANRMCEA
ncbi:MAG: alpha-isopropylmalate synthase regulatory domain-containing protein [Rhodococcus sp. (in: high G+C Gram-positive bacteria)]